METAAMTIFLVLMGMGFMLCVYLIVRVALRHEVEEIAAKSTSTRKWK